MERIKTLLIANRGEVMARASAMFTTSRVRDHANHAVDCGADHQDS